MGKYTDANAACATPVAKKDNGEDVLCGHFVADHTWDDPNQRQAGEADDAWADRVKAAEADAKGSAKREELALDRKVCHAYVGPGKTCTCISYTDSTLSLAARKEAQAAGAAAADKAMNARIKDAVSAALAERDAAEKKGKKG